MEFFLWQLLAILAVATIAGLIWSPFARSLRESYVPSKVRRAIAFVYVIIAGGAVVLAFNAVEKLLSE